MAVKRKILESGKIYTYSGTEGSYSVILGEILEGSGYPSLSYGDSAPTAGSGKNGDIHIDKTNFKIYTRGSSNWDSGVNFKGVKGDAGSTGSTGATGSSGSNGTNGADAITGYLTNESDVVTADAAGVVSSLAAATGNFVVQKGGSTVNTSIVYYAGTSGTGTTQTLTNLRLTVNSSTGDYSLAETSAGAWSSNRETFTMRAIYSGVTPSVTVTKTYKISKAVRGISGTNGNSLLQGITGPSAGDGNNGDTFLDAANHVIYTKTAGSWSSVGSSFKGSAGSSLLQGVAAPSSGDGKNGDTFLDTQNHIIFNKSGGSWSAVGTSFKGAGVNSYSVALGSDASLTDKTLSTAYSDLYLADVLTNVGSFLSASNAKESTTFTFNTTGRYKFDIQAALSASNANTGATYAPTGSVRILSGSSKVLFETAIPIGNLSVAPTVSTTTNLITVENISRIIQILSGSAIKVQAKTSVTAASPAQKTYLLLATDSEPNTAADTVLTITKL